MNSERDRKFFYSYSLVIGLLVLFLLLTLALSRYLGMDEDSVALKQSTRAAANTMPVGNVNVPEEEEAGPMAETAAATAGNQPENIGEKTYKELCISCHNGLPGIPRVGDKAAWESRIAQGMALLYERSIKGFISESGVIAMPPRGGNPGLSDEEVKAAVDYMVANSR